MSCRSRSGERGRGKAARVLFSALCAFDVEVEAEDLADSLALMGRVLEDRGRIIVPQRRVLVGLKEQS